MNFIKQIKSAGILFGLASLIIGIVLWINPVQSEVLLNTVVGIGLIVMGIIKLVQEIMMRQSDSHAAYLILVPILMVILGVFILINPGITLFTVGIIIAILAFSLAFDRFSIAAARKKMGLPYASAIIFGIIQLIFGFLMCWNSIAGVTAIVIVTGIYLVINGIMIIASSLLLKDFK